MDTLTACINARSHVFDEKQIEGANTCQGRA